MTRNTQRVPDSVVTMRPRLPLLRLPRKSRMGQLCLFAYRRSLRSGLIAHGNPTVVRMGMSFVESPYAKELARSMPRVLASRIVAVAFLAP